MTADNNNATSMHVTFIESLDESGFGVTQYIGANQYRVRGVWIHEEVEVSISEEDIRVDSKNLEFAFLQKIITPHPSRRESMCEHMGTGPYDCHGCSWMFMKEEEQAVQKRKRLIDLLLRSKVEFNSHDVVQTICPKPFTGYRNRARVRTNGSILGFVNPIRKRLVDISDCIIMNKPNRAIYKHLRNYIRENQTEKLGFVDIVEETSFRDLSQTIQPGLETLLNKPTPFRQACSHSNLIMKNELTALLKTVQKEPEHILELFCGSGNFTSVLNQLFSDASITAIDSDSTSINFLKRQYPRIHAMTLDLFKPQPFNITIPALQNASLVLVDPPRKGIPNLKGMLSFAENLKHIVYFSCSAASFTNDAATLQDEGFKLKSATPIDAFRQTPQLEILGFFTKL